MAHVIDTTLRDHAPLHTGALHASYMKDLLATNAEDKSVDSDFLFSNLFISLVQYMDNYFHPRAKNRIFDLYYKKPFLQLHIIKVQFNADLLAGRIFQIPFL